MARIDKVTMLFRGLAGTALSGIQSVTVGAGGSILPAGTADAVGVVCTAGTIVEGHPVGVLVQGEIVEFGGSAGTKYYSQEGGTIGTAEQTSVIGTTVEGDRLVVLM